MGAFTSRTNRIVVLGLDNAGKTTLLSNMQKGEFQISAPAPGYNVKTQEFETAVHGNMALTTMVTWDLGGRCRARATWRQHYKDADAIIFVVDSADRRRMQDAHEEFNDLLREEELLGKPVLVYANKQDLRNAVPGREVVDSLGLRKLERDWHLQECALKTGAGISPGLAWLAEAVSAQRANVSQTSCPGVLERGVDEVSTADTEDEGGSRNDIISAAA